MGPLSKGRGFHLVFDCPPAVRTPDIGALELGFSHVIFRGIRASYESQECSDSWRTTEGWKSHLDFP